jgi:hypothetical protein
MTMNGSSDHRALADLLPFYVTGKLSREEMQRVELALAEDAALRHELALVEEEQIATVEANERLGMPSSATAQRFFAMLEAEPARTTPKAVAKDIFAWLGERLQSLAPRQMAFAGTAAAVLIVAQAGFIATKLQAPDDGNGVFRSASSGESVDGTFVIVTFQPTAEQSDVSRLLASLRAKVVDGPRTGDIYKLRIGRKDMPKEERDALIAKLNAEKAVIGSVRPSL